MNFWPVEHFFEHICHHFWMGLLFHQHPQQQTHPKLMTNMIKKVFNWSEVHLSKVTSYKIYTLHEMLKFLLSTYTYTISN